MSPNSSTASTSRCDLIVIIIDVVGSTAMKFVLPEAAWLHQMLLFKDIVEEAVARNVPDATWKSNGDGMLIFIPNSDLSLQAIMLAIEVQEALADANLRVDGAMGTANIGVSIAIATGSALPVEIHGAPDYWGYLVDKSARLCSAASANAIFVDPSTYEATNIRRVTSRVGLALQRQPSEYVGPCEQIAVKGVVDPIGYHEVMWGRQRFGVRSEFVTKITQSNDAVAPALPPAVSTRHGERLVGKVKYYNADKRFGFVIADDGEEFYLAPGALVYPEDAGDLKSGTSLVFTAAEASSAGRSRRAAAALLSGASAVGTLVAAPGERPYGWIKVRHTDGSSVNVFAHSSELPSSFSVGDDFDFELEVTAKGAKAVRVTRASASDAA